MNICDIQTHATLHTCTGLYELVLSAYRFIQTDILLQISQRNFREFREWKVIWLKRTKLQEMRIIDPPL